MNHWIPDDTTNMRDGSVKIFSPFGLGSKSAEIFLGGLRFFYLAICFAPLLYLLLITSRHMMSQGFSLLKLMIPLGRRFPLFLRTLCLSFLVATGGSLIGYLVATFLWYRFERGIKYLRYLIWLILLVPPCVYVLCWNVPVEWINTFLKAARLNSINFQGFWAAWWVETMIFVTISVVLTLHGFESVDSDLIESARISSNDLSALIRVASPLAFPQILAGWGFIFLFSLLNFSIPSLFLVKTYSLEIFSLFSANNNPSEAFAVSFPLLVAGIIAVLATLGRLREILCRHKNQSAWKVKPYFPSWLKYLIVLSTGLIGVQISLPFIVFGLQMHDFRLVVTSLMNALGDISYTLLVSLLAAVLSIPISFAVVQKLLESGRRARLWWLLVLMPLAIPSQLTGIGLIAIWNHPLVSFVYSSSLMPALGNLARFLPLSVIILYAWIINIDRLLFEASLVFQSSLIKRIGGVNVPLFAPGIISAFFFVFLLSSGELATTLLLVPPGKNTLTIKIYNYLHYGTSETVVALSLVMICIVLILAAMFVFLFRSLKIPKEPS